ncbi:uncharacterized protein LOC136066907 [Quercus suber]|uniref:uncharacterized protein LOC136066907 n=1 Tax=Quercus suber TaxID=58331 RepID=UPI0032E00317
MQEGETLKTYLDRYWEMFNEMEGDCDGVTLNTFKLGLPTDHGLRKPLTGKPVTNTRQLIDRIDKYKRVEEDQQQGKGKDKVIPKRGGISSRTVTTIVNHGKILLHNQDHQIFKQSTLYSKSQCTKSWKRLRMNHSSSGRIRWWEILRSVIIISIASTIKTMGIPQRIAGACGIIWTNWSARVPAGDLTHGPKKAKSDTKPVLGFSNEDKVGTIQPHDDALVITLRIRGYDVKRIMVDQGSAVEIMYPDLYKGLNLKPDDLAPYNSPLMSFEGRVVILKGQI